MEGLFPPGPYPRDPPELRIRTSPMQVLCLGLSRTGTMSTYAGLKKLGYTPYHAAELSLNMANDSLQLWTEATDAKFRGKGRPFTTAIDFDKMLYKYDAVTDIPCVLFTDELLAAYPNAKVILSTRDTDSWMSSVEATFYPVLQWWSWWFLRLLDPTFSRLYPSLISLPLFIWSSTPLPASQAPKTFLDCLLNASPRLPRPSSLGKGYEAHNAHVRSIVSADRLLEWHPRDGWTPLCEFLEKEVPDEFRGDGMVMNGASMTEKTGSGKGGAKPFPNINEKGATPKLLGQLVMFRWILLGVKTAKFWGKWGVVLGVTWAAWRWRGEGLRALF